jgi:hypothetical protein
MFGLTWEYNYEIIYNQNAATDATFDIIDFMLLRCSLMLTTDDSVVL